MTENQNSKQAEVLDSYQFSFAQNAQNIFRLLCKPTV